MKDLLDFDFEILMLIYFLVGIVNMYFDILMKFFKEKIYSWNYKIKVIKNRIVSVRKMIFENLCILRVYREKVGWNVNYLENRGNLVIMKWLESFIKEVFKGNKCW